MKSFTMRLPDHALVAEFQDSASPTMSFLRDMVEAVRVFNPFHDWMGIGVRLGADDSDFVYDDRPFEEMGGYDVTEDDPQRGWWVMNLRWDRLPNGGHKHEANLYSRDFLGEHSQAAKVFSDMLEYLQRYVALN